MAKDDLEQSFSTLKQTLPLLLKHKVPAVPVNYALWYTYVSNQHPQLNEALDSATEKGASLSAVKAQDLYQQYVASHEDLDAVKLRQSVEAMLIELNQSMKDTQSDAQQYKATMDKCLDDLNRVEQEGWSLEEVMGLVRNMVADAQSIRASTLSFNNSINNAEQEIKRLREQLKESQQAALYDALTNLANRRYFDSELSSKIGMEKLALLLIDIDHFKVINDTHGHQTGDAVLKAVASKLNQACRDEAQVFRYGGEEFAVLVAGGDLAFGIRLAEQLRKQVEKISVKNRRTGDVLDGISVSIGVAEKSTKDAKDSIIERADQHLYQAKKLGRNRVLPMHP